MDDIANTFNVAQPIVYGGTGAASVITGWDALNAKGTDIATAGTVNLTTATGPNLTLTGTTTVTGVTLAEGNVRFVRANAVFQLTASANLIINGSTSANYTTTAGDLLIFIGGAAGVVRVWAISGSVAAASNAEVLAGVVANKYVSPATAYFPTGFVYGLTLTTDPTDATNDIGISTGAARSDDDLRNYLRTTSLIKRADATWVVGTNQGGLDTGAIGNNRYAIWGIGRSDTKVTDVLFSLSFTAPTMPTNYDYKVLLGEFTRAAGVNGTPLWYGARRTSTSYDGVTLFGPINTTTGGTSITYTSAIPSIAKGFLLSINGVSFSGTSIPLVQLGVGGTYQTTGYLGGTMRQNGGTGTSIQWGAGISMETIGSAVILYGGWVMGQIVDPNTGQWTLMVGNSAAASNAAYTGSGYKVLGGLLDSVRLIATNGTDTLDANAGVQLSWW